MQAQPVRQWSHVTKLLLPFAWSVISRFDPVLNLVVCLQAAHQAQLTSEQKVAELRRMHEAVVTSLHRQVQQLEADLQTAQQVWGWVGALWLAPEVGCVMHTEHTLLDPPLHALAAWAG